MTAVSKEVQFEVAFQMTSLSSDVTNAVWHAYHHHEELKGLVSRADLTVSHGRRHLKHSSLIYKAPLCCESDVELIPESNFAHWTCGRRSSCRPNSHSAARTADAFRTTDVFPRKRTIRPVSSHLRHQIDATVAGYFILVRLSLSLYV